jgi:4-hydroxy-3-polyprenylbenzoate decarboxylase
MIIPGVGVAEIAPFTDYETAAKEISGFAEKLKSLGGGYFTGETRIPLIIISDDKNFTAASLANFLWNTFTRSNPSHDIYGIDSGMEFKHWYCRGSLIIDARAKPHHAPVLEESPEIKVLTDRLFKKGGPLEKWSG